MKIIEKITEIYSRSGHDFEFGFIQIEPNPGASVENILTINDIPVLMGGGFGNKDNEALQEIVKAAIDAAMFWYVGNPSLEFLINEAINAQNFAFKALYPAENQMLEKFL